jgi:adenylylsulfate kinase
MSSKNTISMAMNTINHIVDSYLISGKVVWLTGLSGAGKTTIAKELQRQLTRNNIPSIILDGDLMRTGLSRDLDFSSAGRLENNRRIAEVAKLIADNGYVVISATISPLRSMRSLAEQIIGRPRFVEVYVNTSLQVCEKRDVKGLYAKARSGQIGEFTGISAPYEAPDRPAICLDTEAIPLQESVSALIHYLHEDAYHEPSFLK